MYSPFPEEFNRRTISSMATFHFAPTVNNKQNLLDEGVPENFIFVTGNTVMDAVTYLSLRNKTKIPNSLRGILFNQRLFLITLHRRENFPFLLDIYQAIQSVKCKACLFIIPLHPNPVPGKASKKICRLVHQTGVRAWAFRSGLTQHRFTDSHQLYQIVTRALCYQSKWVTCYKPT